MADIMRAATPINNRNIIQPTKEHRDASALPFDFQDISKVKQTNAQSETLGQNNLIRDNGSSATALFSMLKDPEVATTFLKNIFFLREIVGLMPLNNETQTEEMQQLLNRLILTPEEIPQEMINQENISTIFKGELFDTLRNLLFSNGKSVSESIAEKLYQLPLAQIKDGGELPQQTGQTQQSAQNSQTPQTPAENTTQQTPAGENPQPMIEGYVAPQENAQAQQNGEIFQQAQQPAENSGVPHNELPQGMENNQSIAQNTENTNPQQALDGQDRDAVNRFFENQQTVNATLKNSGQIDIPQLLKEIQTQNDENITTNPEKTVVQRELQDSIINLLKAINSRQNRGDVLDAVKNNLNFLKESFPETSDYARNLDDLSKSLESLMNGKLPQSDFPQVKSQILNLLESLQNSVLYDGEMAKTAGLAKYNLSRYNSNDNLIAEAFSKLLQNVPDKKMQTKLTKDLVRYLETEPLREASFESKTMSALAEILEKQSEKTEAKMLNADSIDKIVYGLLSSPSNFTPLLHYVIPVDNGQAQAMAEIWINPNGEEDVEGANSGKKMTHMLVVFEIEGIGKFETELFAEDKNISLSVMCPPEYVSHYKNVNADIRRACESTGYRFKSIEISELKELRSLIDVFRSLPARRSGINVTI